MRLAFFLLVFANLAFFVWSAGYLGEHRSGREPERLSQQLAPDSIRLLRDAAGAPATEAKPAEPAAAVTASAPAPACRLVSGLASDEAVALERELAAAGFAVNLQSTAGAARYWVLFAGLSNRAAADKKLGELKQLGISDAKVMADEVSGPFIVQLAGFTEESAAQEHLAALNKRGVRTARVDARDNLPAKPTLEVRLPTDRLERLTALSAAYAGAAVADCPAAP